MCSLVERVVALCFAAGFCMVRFSLGSSFGPEGFGSKLELFVMTTPRPADLDQLAATEQSAVSHVSEEDMTTTQFTGISEADAPAANLLDNVQESDAFSSHASSHGSDQNGEPSLGNIYATGLYEDLKNFKNRKLNL